MNSIKAITFDLDNTLWETDVSILGAERVMHDHLLEVAPAAMMADFSLEAFRATRATVVAEQPDIAHQLTVVRRETLIRWFIERGASRAEAEGLAGEGFRVFYHARQQVEPYPGTEEALAKLASRFPLAAITNGNADLMAMPLGRHFKFSLQAEHFPAAKPDPAMFESALDRLGVPAHACLHVGDDLDHDVRGAQAVGMKAVWVNTRGREIDEGFEPDLIVRRVADLLDHL